MVTITVLAGGFELARQAIVDRWDDYTDVSTLTDHPFYGELIDRLVEETVRAGEAALPDDCDWQPLTAEIVGPAGTDLGEGWDPRMFVDAAVEDVDYDAVKDEVFGVEDNA